MYVIDRTQEISKEDYQKSSDDSDIIIDMEKILNLAYELKNLIINEECYQFLLKKENSGFFFSYKYDFLTY